MSEVKSLSRAVERMVSYESVSSVKNAPDETGSVNELLGGEELGGEERSTSFSLTKKLCRLAEKVMNGGSPVDASLADSEVRRLAEIDPLFRLKQDRWEDSTITQLRALADTPPKVADQPVSDGFFQDLQGMIDFIKNDYLAAYENMLGTYSAFYKEFNESIMAKMSEWIKGKNDGKDVEILVGKFFVALTWHMRTYSAAPKGVAYPPLEYGAKQVSEVQARNWAKAMGIPDKQVRKDSALGWVVMMDLSPLIVMRSSLIAVDPPDAFLDSAIPPASLEHILGLFDPSVSVWDSAKFQSWQTGFNSQESELKNQLQKFTTKYANANSYYENFNKILSAQLGQYSEMLKQMANAIG